MYVYYKKCKCIYGTHRVNREDKPVFYYQSSPPDVMPYDAGFIEVNYGLWCHFLSDEEFEKIENYIEKRSKEK